MAGKTRSPNYPVVDLERAVELAEKLQVAAQHHPLPVADVIADAWQMKAGSSYGFQCIAALRQFGLAEDIGKSTNRQVKLTSAGRKIALGHSDRPRLLREAALAPKVHGAIWERYGEDGIPPDATLKQYLVLEYDPPFNSTAVETFLQQFRRTLDFAKVGIQVDLSDDEDQDDDTGGENLRNNDDQPPENRVRIRNRVRQPAMHEATMPLAEGTVKLELPATLSRTSYKRLESWLELMKSVAEDSVESGDSAETTGSDSSG